MTALLRAEARKLTATRSALVIVAATVSYGALTVGVAAVAPESMRPDLDRDTILLIVRGVSGPTVLAAVLLGILASAGEYRHGTIVPTLLAEPRRGRFLAAKLIATALLGAGMGAAASALALAAGVAYLASRDAETGRPVGDVLITVLGVVIVAAVHGVLGAALGALVRRQSVAVTAALLWILAIEQAVPTLVNAPELHRWLLEGAGTRLLHLVGHDPAMASVWGAVVVFAVAVTALTVPAGIRTRHGDIP